MRILSPAKINLHLRVGPLAADGFHPLLSWMCTVGLHDTIDLEPASGDEIKLSCDRPGVPLDATNLIVRAGKMLDPLRAAEVNLKKQIPMGGGLGGGSSNAAFALIGFNRMWNLNLLQNRLSQIAAQLGSDVTFFLHGPSSICAGRGEHVRPIDKPRAKFAVLIFPKLSMSTPAVYRRFDEMKLGSMDAMTSEPAWNAWTEMSAKELLEVLINDLEAPAFSICPDLGEMRSRLQKTIGRIIRMSGSGSTLFTLTDNRNEAERAVKEIRQTGFNADAFELAADLGGS